MYKEFDTFYHLPILHYFQNWEALLKYFNIVKDKYEIRERYCHAVPNGLHIRNHQQ